MFICVCNGIRDKDVSSSVANGCHSAASVFKELGCRPQCGQCVPYVREQISQLQQSITSE